MGGYTAQEVAKLLDLGVAEVHGFVRSGLLEVERGPRRELRFGFQDLILLRTAKELLAADVSLRRIRRALALLKRDLPSGRSLTGLSISADGDRIVVSDGRERWNPESGQHLFDFSISEIAEKVAPLARRPAEKAHETGPELEADEWYEHACELEPSSPNEARDAYRRVLEIDPAHADAHLNLGRLLHEAGELAAAEAHYRRALDARAGDATAAFNLGVVLEDLRRDQGAIEAYRAALAADRDYRDAHYNLGRLYERLGEPRAALRHLTAYRSLVRRS